MAFTPSWTDRVDLFSPVPSLALGSPRPPSGAVFADSPVFTLDSPASTASITSFGPRDEYPFDSPSFVSRRGAFSRDMTTPDLSPEPTHRSTFGSAVRRESEADKRRSVRLAKDTLVNWARPLQSKAEASENIGSLFGASLQRNRRLCERISVPLESPASSCDEHIVTPAPSTPTSEVNAQLASSPELSPLAFKLTGLGFKGVEALDALDSQVVDSPKRAKPSASARSTPSTPRTVFEVSDSLRHLSTPTTLEELQSLRAAAWELEVEARRPFRSTPATTNSPVMHTPHTPHTPEASGSRPKREKRIRRKAVPVISEYLNSRVLPFSTETPVMRSIIPDIVHRTSSEGSACADDEEDDAHDDDHLDVFLSCPSSPAMRTRELGSRQGMYSNRLGTMSAIEVSSRQSAIRFAAPQRAMPMPPVPESLERGDVGYSSTSSLSDHLLTPTRVSSSSSQAGEALAQAHGKAGNPGGIYRSKNAFMSMLDLGLAKVAAQDGQKAAPSDEKKQRRGLAKLLKRR